MTSGPAVAPHKKFQLVAEGPDESPFEFAVQIMGRNDSCQVMDLGTTRSWWRLWVYFAVCADCSLSVMSPSSRLKLQL